MEARDVNVGMWVRLTRYSKMVGQVVEVRDMHPHADRPGRARTWDDLVFNVKHINGVLSTVLASDMEPWHPRIDEWVECNGSVFKVYEVGFENIRGSAANGVPFQIPVWSVKAGLVQPCAPPKNNEDLATVREERDRANATLRLMNTQYEKLMREHEREKHHVAVAINELGAQISNLRTRNSALEEDDRNDEALGTQLKDARDRLIGVEVANEKLRDVVRQRDLEIAQLRTANQNGDPYRAADELSKVEVIESLRAENAQLKNAEKKAIDRAAEAADDYRKLAVMVERLRHELRVLSHRAGAFKQNAEPTSAARRELDNAIDSALAALECSFFGHGTQMSDLAHFFDAKAAWSLETFGPGDRYAGVIEHIRKELEEVLAKPDDLVEWVDIVLLAMDGAWRSAGADGAEFVASLVAKDAKNRKRTWPDWRTLAPGAVSEHVKDGES